MTNDTTCQPRDLEATDLTIEHLLLLTCELRAAMIRKNYEGWEHHSKFEQVLKRL